jgi:two-component sensor histidine kinase
MNPWNEVSTLEHGLPEEHLLLREYSHRINNEISSAISMISLTASRSANEEVKAILSGVIDRLSNYVRVDRALRIPEQVTSVDAGRYLRQLCQTISGSKLEFKGIQLVLVERPLRINAVHCWRLGMIVSELITNAAHHAFREHGGTIVVELLSSTSLVECRVTDDGTADANARPGHGLKIVEALAKGLSGDIRHQFGPGGSTSVVSFPRILQQIEQSFAGQTRSTVVMEGGNKACTDPAS